MIKRINDRRPVVQVKDKTTRKWYYKVGSPDSNRIEVPPHRYIYQRLNKILDETRKKDEYKSYFCKIDDRM
jgi:hypothetical protein